ncbi:MAG: prolipoprotein diacylglyceryl transferase [Acidobacteria bacterium]|nr:prolipoprotein diacylglyceryl transferase [Acidobacteriota bacterium]
MIPILFKLGPITIYSYGLMMALGFIAAYLLLVVECRRRKLSSDFASSIIVWGAIGGLAGARLWDVYDQFPSYAQHPLSIIFSSSGFVWDGGLLGGLLAVYLISHYYKVPFLTTADMAAPAVLIGQALGRMGCLLSGDGDWGLPTKMPWGMSFPHAIVGWNSQTVLKLNAHDQLVSGFYPGVRVQPTPIFEAVLYVAIAVFLIWAMRKRHWAEGRVFYAFLVLSGGARFLVEFWRINPRVLWGLTEYQIFSILLMAVGVAALVITRNRKPAAVSALAGPDESGRSDSASTRRKKRGLSATTTQSGK